MATTRRQLLRWQYQPFSTNDVHSYELPNGVEYEAESGDETQTKEANLRRLQAATRKALLEQVDDFGGANKYALQDLIQKADPTKIVFYGSEGQVGSEGLHVTGTKIVSNPFVQNSHYRRFRTIALLVFTLCTDFCISALPHHHAARVHFGSTASSCVLFFQGRPNSFRRQDSPMQQCPSRYRT